MRTAASPSPAKATGGYPAALERGHLVRLGWTQDGTLISAVAYATARDIPPSALSELEAKGELFSLDIDGARWYPSELLKMPPAAAAAICRTLAGSDPAQQLIFLMRTHGALAGQAAAEAVAQGGLAKVLQLAHAWRL